MKKDTMLADYLMLPWSAVGKLGVFLWGFLVKLPAYLLPIGLFVGLAMLANRFLNQRGAE
jgi:hypothetical protein